MRFILASASPRRQELLARLLSDFTIIPSTIEEVLNPAIQPLGKQVAALAADKARAVAKEQAAEIPSLVLGADTLVCLGETVLGKPQDQADAFRMLKLLSGSTHQVITGLGLIRLPDYAERQAYCISEVTMREIKDAEITAYIASGEPMDKAGAYAIQGGAGAFITQIRGAYDNIVGLPVYLVEALMGSLCHPMFEV